MSDTTIELGLLGENVKKLREDLRGVKLAIDLMPSQFAMLSGSLQTGLQQAR